MLVRIQEVLVNPAEIAGVCCVNEDAPLPKQICAILLRNGKAINVRAPMADLFAILQPLIKPLRAGRIIHKS